MTSWRRFDLMQKVALETVFRKLNFRRNTLVGSDVLKGTGVKWFKSVWLGWKISEAWTVGCHIKSEIWSGCDQLKRGRLKIGDGWSGVYADVVVVDVVVVVVVVVAVDVVDVGWDLVFIGQINCFLPRFFFSRKEVTGFFVTKLINFEIRARFRFVRN